MSLDKTVVAQPKMAELLVACLQWGDSSDPTSALRALEQEEWAALLALAVKQRMAPLLLQRLTQQQLTELVPEQVLAALRAAYQQTALHTMLESAAVRGIVHALAQRGVPVLLLKGLHLAHTVYDNLALRPMNDVDIMVRREHLAHAVEVVQALGYKSLQPFHIELDTEVSRHLTRFIREDGSCIEVHWNITTPHKFYTIDPEELWARAVPVRVGGAEAWGLSPEDLLLHLCSHTSYQHLFAFGLRPSYDIALTIQHFENELDWETLCQRATRWQWQRGSYLALRLAKELVGARVPDSVLAALHPADFEEMIFQTARSQVLTDPAFAISMSRHVATAWTHHSLLYKARTIWQHIFIPRRTIAKRYVLAPTSPLIPLYYLVHFRDLLQRHGGHVVQLLRTDSTTNSLATQKHTLEQWLMAP